MLNEMKIISKIRDFLELTCEQKRNFAKRKILKKFWNFDKKKFWEAQKNFSEHF